VENSDKKKFSNAFGTLCEIFNKQVSQVFIRVYFQALAPYSIEQVGSIISQAIVSCRFFPKPVELIEFITGSPEDLSDRAEVEASKVLQAIKYHGVYSSIQFDDTVTSAVIQQGFGGWIKLCEDLYSVNEKWFIRDFIRIYQAYARQSIDYDGHLPGLIEIDNTIKGYDHHISDPVLIGDSSKFKQIAERKHEEVYPDVNSQNKTMSFELIDL
jgi:hypothetical protein